MTARPHYRGFIADSRRWDGFTFRDDDIVISTPPKSGTTWTQMLTALLLFDGSDFPAPVNVMSPWLDMNTLPLDEVIERLDQQRHRRFIKTHLPLDAVPWDDRVTYVMVGRDPREVSVSMWHHIQNLDPEKMLSVVREVVGDEYLESLPSIEWPDTLPGVLRFDIEQELGSNHAATHLAWVLHHLQTGWERRHLDNVALFHFADLRTDAAGQMRRLADVLGHAYDDTRIDALAAEASLGRMRQRAADVAPTAEQDMWLDTERFFRAGTSGEWQQLMTAADAVRYDERVAELVEPDLAHWVDHGWGRPANLDGPRPVAAQPGSTEVIGSG